MKTTAILLLFEAFFLQFYLTNSAHSSSLHHLSSSTVSQCERIKHSFCSQLPYNFTSFPNMVGDASLRIAEDNIQGFEILLNSACSEQLRFFLCSVYFPMCNEKIPKPIGPCRPLCQSVQKDCLPLLKDFGFSWPHSIECGKFPAENIDDSMCMRGPNKDGDIPRVASASPNLSGSSSRNCQPDYVYLNRTGQCVPMCTASQGILQADKDSSSTTLFILSVASLCLTLLCLLFYVIRPDALVSLSERSLLWAALALALSSIIYLLSLVYRNQIACTDYSSHVLFVVSPLPHIPCSVVGALLYYFGTVGRLYWFVMCATWNPHTSTAARFEKHRVQVHMLACSIPLFLVMLSLMTRSIAAHPLTGICLVGQSSRILDTLFNLIRELVLLTACAIPLLLGSLGLLGSVREPTLPCSALIALLYPIASLFYMLSFANDLVQPSVGWSQSWNIVMVLKLCLDQLLAVLCSLGCLLFLLSNLLRSSRNPASKAVYQPALPRFPPPGSLTSHNTYASAIRAQQQPNLC